ncbi:MAG TPA: DEAD/DEAH box helicase, partial [Candidatus Saccharimonadaceae bacterium]|nr:DEAD/DEAH box helicase [Candidatus Saccharimonadaceae bacterium]
MNLSSKLIDIRGVGVKTAEQLAAAGLMTVGDIITFLPYRHEDFSEITPIAEIAPGKRTIEARCEAISTRRVRRGMTVTTATLADASGKLRAVWFNQPYRVTQLKNSDELFYFSGEFEFSYNRYQMTNPSVEMVKDMPVQTDRILPVYRQIRGLKSQIVRKILAELRPFITMIPETLPPELVKREKLLSYSEALLGQHFPLNADDIKKSRERLAFEELFQLLLAAARNRRENEKLSGWKIPFQAETIRDFVRQLPFQLTNAQRKAAWEIMQDFEKPTPMNRLLQGDVGAGKTVVAALAAQQATQHGFQTALLAPTEILAKQHAETLRKFFAGSATTVALYTGSVKGKKRETLLENLANGAISIVVGTHALLEPSVTFHRLGFVIIDEQHRFG